MTLNKVLIKPDGRIAVGTNGRVAVDNGHCPCCMAQRPCTGSLAAIYPVDSLSQVVLTWNPDREPVFNNGAEIGIRVDLGGVVPIPVGGSAFSYEGDCSPAMANGNSCTQGPGIGGTLTLSAECGSPPDGPLSAVFAGISWPDTCVYRWGDGGFWPASGCAQFRAINGLSGPFSITYQGRLRNVRFYSRLNIPVAGLGRWEGHLWDGPP